MNEVVFVLAFSILFQLAAAFLALRLIKLTGKRTAWVLIAAALALMALRRCITLSTLFSGDSSYQPDLFAEIVALATSILMFAGVAWIAPLFLSIRDSQKVLRKAHDELSKANEALRVEIKERKLAEEALKRYREHLEELVEERTAELKKSNEQLRQEITERKSVEEAPEESETRYRRLFETAQDGILLLDAETGQITDVNPFLKDMLGYSHEQFLGKKLWEIGIFKDIAASKAAFLELQSKGYIRYEDLPLETKDGRHIDVEFVSNVYLVNNKEVIQCNIRDITERKQVEEELGRYREHLEELVEERTAELKKSNEQLQQENTERKRAEEKVIRLNRVYSMLSGINQVIIRVRDLERLFEEACRIAVEQGLFRMAWIGLVDPETLEVRPVARSGFVEGFLDDIRISISNVPEGQGPTGTAIREGEHFVCNDIERDQRMLPWRDEAIKRGYCSSAAFPLRVGTNVVGTFNVYSSEPHFFDDEEIRLLDELATDISFALEYMEQEEKRKLAEEALEKSDAFLRLQIYRMPIGCILLDSEFRVVSWNPAAEEIFGFKAGEALGKHPYGLIVPKEAQPHVDTIWRRLLEGDVTAHSVNENKTKDGRIIICSWSNTPLKEPDGTIKGVLSMVQDITERRRAEEMRIENERLEAQNDFKTIMANILPFMLQRIPPDRKTEIMQGMSKQVEIVIWRKYIRELPTTTQQTADASCSVMNSLGGCFSTENVNEKGYIVINRRCPWGEHGNINPVLCMLTKAIFARIGIRVFKDIDVDIKKTIAGGDSNCLLEVHIRKN